MKRLVCLVTGLLLLCSSALATPANLVGRTKYELIGPTEPFAPGPVKYQLVIYPSGNSGSITVDIAGDDRVIYNGPPNYELTYTNKEPITIDIDLTIPANDTTSVHIFVDERDSDRAGPMLRITGITSFFVSDESTVIAFDHDPRPRRDYELEALKRERDSARAVRDSVREARLHPGVDLPWNGWSGPLVTGRDSAGNVTWDSVASERLKQGIEPKRTPKPVPPTVSREDVHEFIEERKEQAQERQKQQMEGARLSPDERIQELIEANPTALINETVFKNDTLWIRRKGETDFRPVPPITDMQAHHTHIQDSLAEEAKDNLYDVSLDLRETEHRRLVDSLSLDLESMDRAGFYRATMLRPILLLLKSRGVPCGRYPQYPGEAKKLLPSPESNIPAGQGDLIYGNLESGILVDTIYYDGFENANWYQGFQRGDSNALNGYDYWGAIRDTHEIAPGDSTLHCAGVGGLPIGSRYDDYMDAYITRYFQLSEPDGYRLHYEISYDTESGYDYCELVLWYNGNSYPWELYDGFSLQWLQEQWFIDEGESSVGVTFFFIQTQLKASGISVSTLTNLLLSANILRLLIFLRPLPTAGAGRLWFQPAPVLISQPICFWAKKRISI